MLITMGQNWNDSLDHIVTAVLAIVLSAGLFVLQIVQGSVPDWAIAALATVLGFYFRGRVNGVYNNSQMSRLERLRDEVVEAAAEARKNDGEHR